MEISKIELFLNKTIIGRILKPKNWEKRKVSVFFSCDVHNVDFTVKFDR